MKNQFFQMTFKEVEVKAGKVKIKGLASTPQVDRYNDIVKPEAFMNAMATYMLNPIVLLQHDSCKPIGKVTAYQITADGLEVEAEISNDVDNCMKLITDKILRGFSIGFMVKKWEYQTNTTEETMQEIRVITELDLVEISVVSTPANPGSIFTLSKSIREFFLTKDADASVVKEEIIESVQPEASGVITPVPKTEVETVSAVTEPVTETPAQEAQPTETQPQTTETSGATPETPAVVVVEEAPKAETPSEVEILTSEVNALKTKLEELAKLNEALVSENAKLKTDNGEKDKAISELSTKTISLEEKMSKVGVRRATIVSGTDNVRSYKTITYRDLIK